MDAVTAAALDWFHASMAGRGNHAGYRDQAGCRWLLQKVQGWREPPTMRTDFTDRPQAPGVFDAPGYSGARVIVLEGMTFCPGRVARAVAWRQLASLLAQQKDLVPLQVTDELGTLQSLVRRSDQPSIAPNQTDTDFTWSLQLTAPDPVRYEAAQRVADTGIFVDSAGGLAFPLDFPLDFGDPGVAGRLLLANPGTADVWPTLVIHGPDREGPQKQPALTAPNGDSLVYADQLGAGEYLVIDTRRRRVWAQGVTSRRNRMARAQFDGFKIPAGGEVEVQFATTDYPNPASRATATWRAGFW